MMSARTPRKDRPEGFCVCICGIPGVGKSTFLREYAKRHPADEHITGSSVVKSVIAPATVEDFDRWPEARRAHVRETAILRLMTRRKACPGRLLVCGHFTLRNRATGVIEPVFTPGDKGFYDALVLVEAPVEQVHAWRAADTRKRTPQSKTEIQKHQSRERMNAEECAREMGVPLEVIDTTELESRITALSNVLDSLCPL